VNPDRPGRYLRAYGDTTGDGMVQLSFTLPIQAGPRAEAAAAAFANRLGLDPALVVHAKDMGGTHTFFVVYGRSSVVLDLDQVVVAEREYPLLPPKEINLKLRSVLGRRAVVLGACIGTDAHTVGIDAILSVKGFAGEKGLESYREIKVLNLGAQVDEGELIRVARREKADAVLVSQVVTQKDAHLTNTRSLAAALRAEWPVGGPLLVAGGPRFEPGMAAGLGVDRVFGRATSPREVASYLVHALAERNGRR
jgi:beta-lysine 5,6-aminomutase beta subunit